MVLREWGNIWKKLYVERETYKFTTLRKVMRDLLDWRRQLVTGTLTQDQTRELHLRITSKVDWGNRKLGLDLVPRIGAQMVNPDLMSIVELYQLHVQGTENSQGASSRGTVRRKESSRKVLTHHLYFCMRDFGHRVGEDTEIYFSLYDPKRAKFISERFLVRISKDGSTNTLDKLHSNCTVFSDLGNADLCRGELFIVAHVMRLGKMLYSESSSKKSSLSSNSSTPFSSTSNSSSGVGNNVFKRPLGCAVLNIGEMLAAHTPSNHNSTGSLSSSWVSSAPSLPSSSSWSAEEREFTFRVHTCEEKDFHQLHDLLIRKQGGKYNPLSGQPNYGIVVSLRMLHGELAQVQGENPLLFKNVSLTRKLGFSDVIMPGDVRNDLYLTLERGEFERGGKSTGKNIEVTVLVLDASGKPLENCLWGASGMEGSSEYQSMIIYHHNSPWWSETIRLAVPIDKFYGSHARFEYRHCSTRDKTEKKLFGFSFTRLMETGGATLADGPHELHVYKCTDDRLLQQPSSYLHLPSGPGDKPPLLPQSSQLAPSSSPTPGQQTGTNGTSSLHNGDATHPGVSTVFQRSSKEAVHVHTLLCSTKLTQNVDLLSLLQWKANPEGIEEALGRVLRLGGEEVVKFLQDVLDALFSMFSTEDGNSTAHSGLVFHVLVSIFSLMEDSKFEHFKPVMDAYIKGHFAAALVYKGLLSSVQHCAEWALTTEKQDPIGKCFRSLEYIFKFVVQSRLLFARATGGQFEDSFRRDLMSVSASLDRLLAVQNLPILIPTQVALLHSVSPVYECLLGVLAPLEVARLAIGTLESVQPHRDLSPQLIQAKLTAVKAIVTSHLFDDDESRSLLLSTICKHLRLHLAHRSELRLCTDILGEILIFLHRQRQDQEKEQGKVNNCLHHDVEIVCLATLDMLIQTVLIIIDRSASVVSSLVACLVGLLQLLDEFHYRRLWEELGGITQVSGMVGINSAGGTKPLKDFLLRVFLVFRDLVRQEVFQPDWLVMRMASNRVLLNALQELSQPLVFRFLDHNHFDHQLWSNYFNLAVSYLTQPALQLEKFSEARREKIVEKYGDMRVLMGFQILSMWSHLGEHKIHFIPSMVGPFLEVTLVPESELRKATLHIFFDMMECEQQARGNFKQVESELIDKLDILISENKGDDEYRKLFNTILLDRVQSENDPAWKGSGAAFISSVTRLLERLLDYRSVIQGDENRDKRMSCTVNLLNFYKNEINRKEMYVRYIHKLHDLHLAAENFAEAGFTLQLYADQLEWTGASMGSAMEMGFNALPPDARYPGQPQWQRKEQLYHQIIHYFDRGKCWEKGIPLCKELAELYELKLFDYAKLSLVLRTEAHFFDNILTQLRPEPEYFRVGFYGLSFPLFVRNKEFVYRGLEYERIGAFIQRLQTEFPSAQILSKNTPPDDSITNSEGQFIQICNVKPIPEMLGFWNAIEMGSEDSFLSALPEKVASYYRVNDVRKFQFDRPVHKGTVDKENEFKSLWIERTTLVLSCKLPGILRWFEVVERKVEEVPPVAFACETVEGASRELRRLISVYSTDPRRNINPLSMRLQGIIDANVMGGISKYQEAFFSPEFSRSHPEFSEHIIRLKSLILDQVQILDAGLIVHGQLAPSGVQPLHRRLLERFAQLRQGLVREIGGGSPSSIIQSRGRFNHMTLTRGLADGKATSIINTPLPPLPIEKKGPGSGDPSMLPGSNRSSASGSSMYGQLVVGEDDGEGGVIGFGCGGHTDDEDIYSKPMEIVNGRSTPGTPSTRSSMGVPPPPPPATENGTPPPIPSRDSRPKSAGFGSVVSCSCGHKIGMSNTHGSGCALVHGNTTDNGSPLPFRGYGDYCSLPPLRSRGEWEASNSAPADLSKGTNNGDAIKPSSPKMPLRHSLPPSSTSTLPPGNGENMRNSWSETSVDEEEEAPPLPPRGQTLDKRCGHFLGESGLMNTPPAPPKRLLKKTSSVTLMGDIVTITSEGCKVDSGTAETRGKDGQEWGENSPPPIPSPRSQAPLAPPPIPPKGTVTPLPSPGIPAHGASPCLSLPPSSSSLASSTCSVLSTSSSGSSSSTFSANVLTLVTTASCPRSISPPLCEIPKIHAEAPVELCSIAPQLQASPT
ncbi:dedicator of cytokinesis protein 3 [Ischnura elegans]|uniref:dedicator of cytokinesis protein 3 n=1 Tax=Ischnura elegans TaxID=197161 RepID=UPI001ED87E34|nr:dedicator of cytokinesis protein 3 [Ischnura elegans]